MDLRKQFFENMEELAKRDKSVIVLVGDLGFSFFESYAEKFPKQFINTGCAEQNAILVAMGMSLAGFKPYVYSGTIFLLMRPYEQIRNLCYNNLNVKLVGTGASPFLGFSHNLQKLENEEDLLKNLPNLKRYYPKNEKELKKVLMTKNKSPEFIKL